MIQGCVCLSRLTTLDCWSGPQRPQPGFILAILPARVADTLAGSTPRGLGALCQDTGWPVPSGTLEPLTVTEHWAEPSSKDVLSLVSKERPAVLLRTLSNVHTRSEAVIPLGATLSADTMFFPFLALPNIWKVCVKTNMARMTSPQLLSWESHLCPLSPPSPCSRTQ